MHRIRSRRAFAAKLLAVAASAALPFAAAQAQKLPDYYPKSYSQIVEGSKKENKLVVYSIMAAYNWKPVLEGFKKLYPWIEVQTLDLGSSEVFERYYSERASGSRTGDLIIAGAVDKWLQLLAKGEAVDYESPEIAKLPKWSVPRKGLYTVSADPMVIVWNNALVPEADRPKSLADIGKLAQAKPAEYKNKITTYNAATEAFGLNINWAYTKKYGEKSWDLLGQLGKVVRPERSAGPMVEKVTSGEYKIAYFVSGIVLFPKLDDPARAKLLGWVYPSDGTPIVLRGMAIPKGVTNVNSAKLMLDYILSHDGQVGFGKGGLTPYRADVQASEVPRATYDAVVKAVGGEDKVVRVEYDDEVMAKGQAFQERWKKTFGM
ncbi:MAG TPA: extracellular solute-binding protein [Usitatibacter sp.]|nr:extracellular solute-binding protein [Usitatibacter sp.]